MAKEETKEKAEYKYGVANLAEDLGILETSVRVSLRKNDIEKAKGTNVYGWNSKSDYEEVLKKLKESSAKAPAAKKAEKKPAKKVAKK